jgi:hypothetical protein
VEELGAGVKGEAADCLLLEGVTGLGHLVGIGESSEFCKGSEGVDFAGGRTGEVKKAIEADPRNIRELHPSQATFLKRSAEHSVEVWAQEAQQEATHQCLPSVISVHSPVMLQLGQFRKLKNPEI